MVSVVVVVVVVPFGVRVNVDVTSVVRAEEVTVLVSVNVTVMCSVAFGITAVPPAKKSVGNGAEPPSVKPYIRQHMISNAKVNSLLLQKEPFQLQAHSRTLNSDSVRESDKPGQEPTLILGDKAQELVHCIN